MKEFNHLHCHSTYSLLDGYGLPKQYVNKLKENKQTSFALTDHGNTWGHIPFYFALKESGIKPILGNEMYFDPIDATLKRQKRNHITIIASNNQGFENLNILQSWANFYGFYYKPRIDSKRLYQYGNGLIILSGCVGSGYPISIVDNDLNQLNIWLIAMKQIFNKNFYMEVSPLNYNSERILKLIPIADKLKIPIAITSDVHFPNKSDHVAEDIMLTIGLKAQYDSPSRLKLMEDLYLWDNDDAYKRCKDFFGNRADEFIDNTNKIAKRCDVEIKLATPLHFYQNDNENIKAKKQFNELIKNGLIKRNIDKNDKIYTKRIKLEKELIVNKKFINYFLIISDLVKWAKKRMLVGAARGSSAGSLIAYLLEITEIDPIKFELIFERFIDPSRNDLPDIDIDFPHEKKQKIFEYLKDKYGENNVSLLGTLNFFKSKNSIWDVGRIFNIPYNTSKQLANLIIERLAGDLRVNNCIEDSIKENEEVKEIINNYPEYKIAEKIEGQIRQTGVHPAAIVLSKEKLYNFGSFTNSNENKVLSIDQKSIEKINLLKIDVLALKQLTIIENILLMIKKPFDWIYNINLEDKKCFDIINKKLFQGIFQFEGEALKNIANQSSINNFNEFQIISALARPGSLHSGGTNEYFERKNNNKKVNYLHPLLIDITKDTFGVIVYQEQVMKILSIIGKISMVKVNKIRKLINKTMGKDALQPYFEEFKTGALSNKLNLQQINKLWELIITFGSWAFNKSHSISYGHISYWTLFLKTYFVNEFYVCTLQYEDDDLKIKMLLKEWTLYFKKEFITLDANKSQMNFSLHDGILYGGFKNIKGLGEKNAEKIIEYRDISPTTEFFRKKIGKKTFEILDQFNAIPEFKSKQASLFSLNEMEPRRKEESKIPYKYAPWADLIPIDNSFENYYNEFNFVKINTLNDLENNIRIIGIVNEIKIFDNNINLKVEDNTGTITIFIKKSILGKNNFIEGSIIIIQGKKYYNKIYAEKIKTLLYEKK